MSQSGQTLNNGQTCEQVLDLLPAYVIGATDPDETAFVQANLAACPEAASAFPDFQELVDEMREDVPQMAPPADLEDRLMQRLTANAEHMPAISVAARPTQKRSRSLWMTLVAAAAAFALLIGTNLYWLVRVNNLSDENEALTQAVQAQDDDWLTSLTRAQWRRLEGTHDTNVLALVIWKDHDCFLYTLGMPELPSDKVYQLWLVESNNRHVSAGTFRVDERGRGVLTCNSPEELQDFARLGITAEPTGGSSDPTSDPVALGSV